MDDVDASFLSLQLASAKGAVVDPAVFLAILSHAQRRPDDLGRVMGALLGVASDDGCEVDVRQAFPLSITENDEEVSVDSEHLTQMLILHLQANPKENIVGWYSTGDKVDANSALIHEYFAAEYAHVLATPLHLLVDAELKDGRMGIKAFVTSEAGVPTSEFAGTMFLPIPCTVKLNDAERSALDLISLARPQLVDDVFVDVSSANASTTGVLSDMDNLERAVVAILGMVENIQEWVAGVQAGEIPPNDTIGRYLLDTVSAVPLIEAGEFEKLFNNHLQDLLMVVYLSNLTRTQLAIAQRLQNLV